MKKKRNGVFSLPGKWTEILLCMKLTLMLFLCVITQAFASVDAQTISLETLDPSFVIMENNEYGSDPNRLPDIEIRGKSSIVGLKEQYDTAPNCW